MGPARGGGRRGPAAVLVRNGSGAGAVSAASGARPGVSSGSATPVQAAQDRNWHRRGAVAAPGAAARGQKRRRHRAEQGGARPRHQRGKQLPAAARSVGTNTTSYAETPLRTAPAAEWNDLRVVSEAGKLTVYVNGQLRIAATGCEPRKGYIGLQHLRGQTTFRDIRIANLKPPT